jgi:hypothetical protein
MTKHQLLLLFIHPPTLGALPVTRTDPHVSSAIAAFDTTSVFNAALSLLGGGPEGNGLEFRGAECR